MKIGYYIKKSSLESDPRIGSLLESLSAGGAEIYRIRCSKCVQGGTTLVLSLGGDGTFMSTAHRVSEAGIPILGVNFGRMGFLSGSTPEGLAQKLLAGGFSVEEREMLQVQVPAAPQDFWPYALNEVCLHRSGAGMMGVDVRIDDSQLPTYWADGLLVATSSGSTAYSLSAGGPICLPGSKVLLITPVAPHNLNLRPLVIPSVSHVRLSARARTEQVALSLDNRTYLVSAGTPIEVSQAPFKLRMVNLSGSEQGFINALRTRLFWGQDVRNE